MANEVRILVTAKDGASAAFGQVQQSAQGLGSKMGTALRVGGLAAAGGIGLAVAASVKFVGAASNLNESLSKSNVVFGQHAKQVDAWSKTSAKAFGQSRQQALEAAGTFGNLFSAMGLGQEEAAGLSTELVELAADLSSFNNIGTEEALLKLRAGLVGEAEPLRTLGVQLTAATTEAKALEMGLADANGELSEGAKIQARYALILEQTKNAQGDFARTSDGLANKQRILKAQWADMQATIGTGLLPVVIALGGALSDLLTEYQPQIQAFSEMLATKIPAALDAIGRAFSSPVATDIFTNISAGFAVIQPMLEWVMQNEVAVAAAFTAIGAAALLALTPLTPHMLAIGAAIGGLIYVIGLWERAQRDQADAATANINQEKNGLERLLQKAVDVNDAIADSFDFLQHHLINGFRIWSVEAWHAYDWLQQHADDVLRAIGAAWDTLGAVVAPVLGVIMANIRDLMTLLRGMWTDFQVIGAGIREDFWAIVRAVQALIDRIKDLVGWIDKIPTPGDFLPDIPNPFSGAAKKLGGIFASGTPFVPQDMLALVHRGERIIPAAENAAMMSGAGGGGNVVYATFNLSGGASEQDAGSLFRQFAQFMREELGMETLAGPRLPVGAFSPRRA